MNSYRPRSGFGEVIRTVITGIVLVLLVYGGMPRAQSGRLPTRRVTVTVVKSGELSQYDLACSGFLETMRDSGFEVDTSVYVLTDGASEAYDIVGHVRKTNSNIVLTLGTKAVRYVAVHEQSVPIVYSMVFNTTARDRERGPVPEQMNVIGTNLNIPLEVQLREMMRMIPSIKKVGIISNPDATEGYVKEVEGLLRRYGLQMHVAWAPQQESIPDAVRELVAAHVDILWMVPDKTVFTPQSSRYIIFELLKEEVPILGLSSAYVKAGALMALDCVYKDLGRQSGELAIRVLRGESPASLGIPDPRDYRIALNTHVTEQLSIDIAPSLMDDPRIVKF